jgi:hypothetical protein
MAGRRRLGKVREDQMMASTAEKHHAKQPGAAGSEGPLALPALSHEVRAFLRSPQRGSLVVTDAGGRSVVS